MNVRGWIAGAAALLLGVQVVRTAAVSSLAETRPVEAAKFWPGHPAVETQLALIDIAEAARAGNAVDPRVLSTMFGVSSKAPLGPDPFLVRGVQSQLAGRPTVAQDAFVAAARRDPRSLPARYFLADLYFRNGDARRGLPEVAVLARLVPGGATKLAPYIASYAQNRDNWPLLRPVLRSGPNLEEASLAALASDARNAEAVLALSDPEPRDGRAGWLPILMDSLAKAGEYRKAQAIWGTVTRFRAEPGQLFDPRFIEPDAQPPFNWALTSSTVGLAERLPGRGLHVIYYGHEDGVLATQLVVLPPGRYLFGTDAPSLPENADAISWTLRCAQGDALLASVPLKDAASRGWTFDVPPTCPAQRIELTGSSSDAADQADFSIRSVRLQAEGRR